MGTEYYGNMGCGVFKGDGTKSKKRTKNNKLRVSSSWPQIGGPWQISAKTPPTCGQDDQTLSMSKIIRIFLIFFSSFENVNLGEHFFVKY